MVTGAFGNMTVHDAFRPQGPPVSAPVSSQQRMTPTQWSFGQNLSELEVVPAAHVSEPDTSDDVSILSMNSASRRFNEELRTRGAHPILRHQLVRQMQRIFP
jgi:hypothetical protein